MPTPSQKKRRLADAVEECVSCSASDKRDTTDTRRPGMKELIKDTLLVGLGAALLTREKIEDGLRRFVDEGRISSEEAKRTAESIFEKGESELRSVQEQMQNFFGSKLHGLDLAARSDLEDLSKRYHELETQLQAMDIRLRTLEQDRSTPENTEGKK